MSADIHKELSGVNSPVKWR